MNVSLNFAIVFCTAPTIAKECIEKLNLEKPSINLNYRQISHPTVSESIIFDDFQSQIRWQISGFYDWKSLDEIWWFLFDLSEQSYGSLHLCYYNVDVNARPSLIVELQNRKGPNYDINPVQHIKSFGDIDWIRMHELHSEMRVPEQLLLQTNFGRLNFALRLPDLG
jgi:hypothetical protein